MVPFVPTAKTSDGPLPQIEARWFALPRSTRDHNDKQSELQRSLASVLVSSQASPGSITPSPHTCGRQAPSIQKPRVLAYVHAASAARAAQASICSGRAHRWRLGVHTVSDGQLLPLAQTCDFGAMHAVHNPISHHTNHLCMR